MRSFITLVLFVCTVFAGEQQDGSPAWSYVPGNDCPMHWPELYETCGGQTQSPINIDTKKAVYSEELGEFDLITITESNEMTMKNNGKTVSLHPKAELHITGFDKVYKVAGPHFHWGNTSMHGSEHTVDGKAFPIEMHIVTYNTEDYTDIGAAVASGDSTALAVFGFLFKLSPRNNSLLDPIINNLQSIKTAGSNEVVISDFYLKDLWPKIASDFFRYTGSLTTPPCSEVVIWTLFREMVPISEYQLNQFRSVFDDSGEPLVNNYRPVQALNDRKVYASFRRNAVDPPYDIVDPGFSGATHPSSYIGVIAFAAFLFRSLMY